MSVDEVLHGVRRRIYTGSVEPGFDDARPSAVLAVLADGTYTVTATQADDLGNEATSSPLTFTIDTTAPKPVVVAPANNAAIKDTPPTISGTAGTADGDIASVVVRVYAGKGGSVAPTASWTSASVNVVAGSFSTTVPDLSALTNGEYTIRVTQIDDQGNSGVSDDSVFNLDVTAPLLSIASALQTASGSALAAKSRVATA